MFGGEASVADFPETEPLRCAYPSCRVAVARPHDAEQLAGADLARAHVHERADDGAHHLPAERGRGDVEAQHAVAEVVPGRLEHAAHGRRARRPLAAEGGEVVLTEE